MQDEVRRMREREGANGKARSCKKERLVLASPDFHVKVIE